MSEEISVRWEAFVRAFRTFLQGLIAAVLVAAWEAGQAAFASHGFNVRAIAGAVGTAVIIAVVTYVYNLISPRVPDVTTGK